MDGCWPPGSGPVAHKAGGHSLLCPGLELGQGLPLREAGLFQQGSRVPWGLSEALPAFCFWCHLWFFLCVCLCYFLDLSTCHGGS